MRVSEPHVFPGRAPVRRLIHSVARVGAPRARSVSRPNPDDVCICRCNRKRPNRRDLLALEDRLESVPLLLVFHTPPLRAARSEEHTSELQSQSNLVCRLLLEKKKIYELHNLTADTILNQTH